jgi:hypothetical protein
LQQYSHPRHALSKPLIQTMLSEVNPADPRISSADSLALIKMLEKREQYVGHGRNREAHGMGTGIWILWKTLIQESPGNTGYGGLS